MTDVVADAHPPVVAAFFDVDNTVVRGASSYHLARGLYRRQFVSTKDLIQGAIHQARYQAFGENNKQNDQIRQKALSIIAGRTVADIVSVAQEVYDQVLNLRIFPGTKKLIDDHLSQGHQVWLVTAAPVEMGGLIAHRLGATGCLGTVAEHQQGFYTGRLAGPFMHGPAKAQALTELAQVRGIDLDASYAYGDSLNDLYMMKTVGHPCPINPDRRLRVYARDAGWPIREFRGRRHRRRSGSLRTASVAGVAWAVGVIVRTIRKKLAARIAGEG